jgi:hypothetical protein
MPDNQQRNEARHLALGAAARGVDFASGAVRLAFVPLRPLSRVGPVRRYATQHATALAASGAVVERRLLDRADQLAEHLIVRAVDSPATDRIVRSVLAAPGVELAITRVLESELLDATTVRFLQSEEIEQVIERIAHGPELRAAVAAQSAGLADMVAEEVRGRSTAADETAERLARSMIPRRWRHAPPAGAAGT